MGAIAALLDSRAALAALRRTLPRGTGPVIACRSSRGLEQVLQSRLVEAIVLGGAVARRIQLDELRAQFSGLPLIIVGVFRSEDAGLLQSWARLGVAGVAVEGVDDPLLGDLVVRHFLSARLATALAEAPRLLRLREPLQQQTWQLLIGGVGRPPRTAVLARALGMSREHLSRQFAAGGAPNLKRVSDLLTVQSALRLLGNAGYSVTTVATLLEFATPSHLRAVVRRITGLALPDAQGMTEQEVLLRFIRLSARSRK